MGQEKQRLMEKVLNTMLKSLKRLYKQSTNNQGFLAKKCKHDKHNFTHLVFNMHNKWYTSSLQIWLQPYKEGHTNKEH